MYMAMYMAKQTKANQSKAKQTNPEATGMHNGKHKVAKIAKDEK